MWAQFEEDCLAGEAAEEAKEEERKQRRQDKLYHKVMLLHWFLAPPEEREAMSNGWKPQLPPNLSLETQVRILQARIDIMDPQPQLRNRSSQVGGISSGRRGVTGLGSPPSASGRR
jgi:hypothetical protein